MNARTKIQEALGRHPKTSSKIILGDNYSHNFISHLRQTTRRHVYIPLIPWRQIKKGLMKIKI